MSVIADVATAPAAQPARPRRRPSARTPQRTALVVHAPTAPPDPSLLEALRAHGLTGTAVGAERPVELPDPNTLALAVVSGSVHRPAAGDLDAWVAWLRAADAAGTAILALGSAAQALTLALGGSAPEARRPRRAWTLVRTTAPELLGAGPWLVWQDAVVALPAGAEVLAEDHAGPMAYRAGRHVAVHLHPGATPEVVAGWVRASDEVLDHQGIMEATWRDARGAAEAARQLFAAFASEVAAAPA